MAAVGNNVIMQYMLYAFLPAFFCTALALFFRLKRSLLILTAAIALTFCIWKFKILNFVINYFTYSSIYQTEYADPALINFSFPSKKHNLIILYLESMEKDYADTALAGSNLLPNLSQMEEAISLDGFHQLTTQDYTIAALVSGMCSVPLKNLFIENSIDYNNFLTGLTCFPKILQDHGYRTYFLKGTDVTFARTGMFLQQHGYSTVESLETLQQNLNIDMSVHQGTSWGIKDRTLYDLAKKRLLKIASEETPFVFSLLTLDTHGPDIYLDPQCRHPFSDKTRNVIYCADNQAADLIRWIKQQDFYKNTTLIVVGDHTKTGGNNLYPEQKERQIVNLFFNSAKSFPVTERKWTTLDLAPTILEALGASFDNGKFGLGRSVLNSEPTLREKLGDQLDIELMKNAAEYKKFSTQAYLPKPKYNDYPEWEKKISDHDTIKQYTYFPQDTLGTVWTDNLSFTLPEQGHADPVLEIWYRAFFNNDIRRTITANVQGEKIAEWTIDHDASQPFHQQIAIPKRLITEDNKILIEFTSDNIGINTLGTGLGIIGLLWRPN